MDASSTSRICCHSNLSQLVTVTEDEAVAFVVRHAVRPEAGAASADYISLWNGDAATLIESLEFVQRTTAEIIAAITPEKPLPPENGG